jgi:NAD(P)-dependent dehydrogenase (short-subunit alcohol dehydrogenase family)
VSTLFAVDGQTALVTGASSGLGRHFALALARAGARVAVCARRTDRLVDLVDEIAGFDGRAMAFAMDVTDGDSVRAAIDAAETELGPLSILVNNAGTGVSKKIVDFTPEDYDLVMNTNLKGAWLVAQESGRRMIAHGHGGAIINIASMAGIRLVGLLSVYGMSKAAVIHMTKYMAQEWARHDIRVNAIAPGYIETELNSEFFASERGKAFVDRFLRKRLGTPADLDGVLMLLASRASDFVTGAVIQADDGLSLIM